MSLRSKYTLNCTPISEFLFRKSPVAGEVAGRGHHGHRRRGGRDHEALPQRWRGRLRLAPQAENALRVGSMQFVVLAQVKLIVNSETLFLL